LYVCTVGMWIALNRNRK